MKEDQLFSSSLEEVQALFLSYTCTKVLSFEDRFKVSKAFKTLCRAMAYGGEIKKKREFKPLLTPKGNDFRL